MVITRQILLKTDSSKISSASKVNRTSKHSATIMEYNSALSRQELHISVVLDVQRISMTGKLILSLARPIRQSLNRQWMTASYRILHDFNAWHTRRDAYGTCGDAITCTRFRCDRNGLL